MQMPPSEHWGPNVSFEEVVMWRPEQPDERAWRAAAHDVWAICEALSVRNGGGGREDESENAQLLREELKIEVANCVGPEGEHKWSDVLSPIMRKLGAGGRQCRGVSAVQGVEERPDERIRGTETGKVWAGRVAEGDGDRAEVAPVEGEGRGTERRAGTRRGKDGITGARWRTR
eukprot:GHVU01159988.1.p2 GENE.GHVU01159988.1~~GHVU01159988.1.p2  ORF type:complete len:174 (+),score=31.99 GHVU01159988.1:1552-2073(+)